MSKDGFTAYVRITQAGVCGGFSNDGRTCESATMELEGRLNTFHYCDLRERITRETKTRVDISIELTTNQETTDSMEFCRLIVIRIRLEGCFSG